MSNIILNKRLQLRSHREIFNTREEAIDYIEREYLDQAVLGEPTLYFYGNENKLNTLISIGYRRGKASFIDFNELKESIKNISTNVDEKLKDNDDIKSLIKVLGLTLDENRITDKVIYNTKPTDRIIGSATSVAEAINLISEYIQNEIKAFNLTTSNSSTITLNSNSNDNNTNLSADVKISRHGITDRVNFNNNIICVKEDGIYASSNLEYDDLRNTLTFTSSGISENGLPLDDAKRKVIQLATPKTAITVNDTLPTPIKLRVSETQNGHQISSTLQISEDEDNLLKLKSDGLVAKVKAGDIKINDIGIDKHINTISEKVTQLENKSVLRPTTTDTSIITIEKDFSGIGLNIKNDIRLSSNNSIIINGESGGLDVDADLTIAPGTNILNFRLGEHTKQIQLPASPIVESVSYDRDNKVINLNLGANKGTFAIPVADMLNILTVPTNQNTPVKLSIQKSTNRADNRDIISAELSLRSNDNLLGVEQGKLYVSENNLRTIITDYTNQLSNENNRLTQKIGEVKNELNTIITEKTSELKSSVNENKVNLSQLEQDVEQKTNKLSEKLTSETTKINDGISARIEEVVSNISTYKLEVEKKFNDNVKPLSTSIESVKNDLTTTNNKVEDLTNNLTSVEGVSNQAKTEVAKLKEALSKSELVPTNSQTNPVKLNISKTADNVSISADLQIYNSPNNDNALTVVANDNLFVSNQAERYFLEIEGQTYNVKQIILLLNQKTKELSAKSAELDTLKQEFEAFKLTVGEKQKEEIAQLTDKLSKIEKTLNTLIDFDKY